MTRLKLSFPNTGAVCHTLNECGREIEKRFPAFWAVPCDIDAVEIIDDQEFTSAILAENYEHPLRCDLSKNELSRFLQTANFHFSWLAVAVFEQPPDDVTLKELYAETNSIFGIPPYIMKVKDSVIELYLNDDCELVVQTTDLDFGKFLTETLSKFDQSAQSPV